MIQLRVLSGKMAGANVVARHFPFRVGRSPAADLRMEDAGVWENHLTFSQNPEHTIELTAESGALVTVNGEGVSAASLRNGDVIEIGAVQLQFGLSPTRQKGVRIREAMVWFSLLLIALLQIGLIYWLLET